MLAAMSVDVMDEMRVVVKAFVSVDERVDMMVDLK